MTTTPSASTAPRTTGSFTLASTGISEGGTIPREFTCDGPNVSPPLAWNGVPSGAAALVLIVDDPSANEFVHWVVINLPAHDGDLRQGVEPSATTPQQGRNDFGKPGWGGPCPPSGTHTYRFTLTALSEKLTIDGQPTGAAVRGALAMAGSKVLGTATLTATYQRG
jgi:Raf kinase inhibitor-like YbhB/YbcL family protein